LLLNFVLFSGKKASKYEPTDEYPIPLGRNFELRAAEFGFLVNPDAPVEEELFKLLNPTLWEAKMARNLEAEEQQEKDKARRGLTFNELVLSEAKEIGNFSFALFSLYYAFIFLLSSIMDQLLRF
jgi:hypothetical protein